MLKIKTRTVEFEDYFFIKEKCQVVSVKASCATTVKPLQDRTRVTSWKLYYNGQPVIVSLAEIMEFTLGIKSNSVPISI